MDLVLASNSLQNYRWYAVSSWLGRVPRDVLFTSPAAFMNLATCMFLAGWPDAAWELTEAHKKSAHFKPGRSHISAMPP
jgi:hypothetical protein